MQNGHQFIIPRLNGDTIKKEFSAHLSLVKKGIAGFILFGGRLNEVRRYVRRLQEAAELPLIISSDLERGLGQQLKGGTLFPPAMALARAAVSRASGGRAAGTRALCVSAQGFRLVQQSFTALAEEARYAGINTILAPVLDINTNPDNPIIGVRSFGEDVATASLFGTEMIRILQKNGIAACGKHFPGHGDTSTDSHISLPEINRSLASLTRTELHPFRKAIAADVAMLMLGHLKVPALAPSGLPVSLSGDAVSYIRKALRYKGLLITDAMNMGGLSGYSEEEASLLALRAGADILLHPLQTDRVAAYLKKNAYHPRDQSLFEFRRALGRAPQETPPCFTAHAQLAETLMARALSLPKGFRVKPAPVLCILSDEDNQQGKYFTAALKKKIPGLSSLCLTQQAQGSGLQDLAAMAAAGRTVITAVYSETRAWKGPTGEWLRASLTAVEPVTALFVSFGNPYLIRHIPADRKLLTYWNSETAERTAAEALSRRVRT